MKNYPKGGLIRKTVSLINYIADQNIGIHAAGACYFIALAVFPALLLVLSLLRYTGLQVEYLTDLMEGFLPAAFMPAVNRLVISTYRNASGTLVSVSALVALWSASRGVHGLLVGLNSIYQVQEDRGWFYTRWVSVLYTFGFLVVLLLTLVLNVFGNTITEYLPVDRHMLWRLLDGVVDFRFFLLLGLQIMLFTGIFMVFPNQRNGFKESLPGAVLSALGWTIFSKLFSLYVEYFPNYANIYGSIYAVALAMLWLYFCISIVFLGGVLNHYLSTRKS